MNYVTLGGGLWILIPHNATYLIFFIGKQSRERDHRNVEQLGKQMKKKNMLLFHGFSWLSSSEIKKSVTLTGQTNIKYRAQKTSKDCILIIGRIN
jgi:hypothetical protein